MIEELVSKVFLTRNLVHLAHWKTKSYAQHKALGNFYEALPGAIDGIVEAYQGAFNLIGLVPIRPTPTQFDPVPYLTDEAAWIVANEDAITQENCAIENLLAALLEEYYSTLYKLRNLS